MKSTLRFTIAFMVLSAFATNGFSQGNKFCGADEMRKELLKQYPNATLSEQASEDFILRYIQENGGRSGPIVIPIVFHIIHMGGPENISDAQVRDQVRILNEDYNKLNADTADVIHPFRNIIGNIGIEFRLPTIDPDGRATNGIQHIWGSQTYGGNDNCKLQPWPRDKYLNVWVFKKMRDGVAGYAYLPGSVDAVAELPMIDGINILHDYVGSIGTSSPYRSRALTHEIGHFLNLRHPWGNTNEPGLICDDDGVSDTPRTKGFTFCPQPTYTYSDNNIPKTFPVTKIDSLFTANPNFYADSIWRNATICTPHVVENFQNFMDYSYCENMFTEGQKNRMLAALNDTIAERNRLWSNASLIAAGVDQNQQPTSSPICDFGTGAELFTCVGEPVTFKDYSYNADIISRTWTFQGADVTTSYDSTVTVTYPFVGEYPVKLDVVGQYGTATKTSTDLKVMDTANIATPYYTGFENAFDFDYYWASVNTGRDNPKFHHCSTAGRNNSQSVLLDCYNNRADMNFDDLISPAFNCTNLNATNGRLSFWYSYATWNTAYTLNPSFDMPDSMTVYITRNCGNSWTKIYADGTNNLFNVGYAQGFFVPGTHPVYWKNVNVAIPATFRTKGVRFRILLSSSHKANNFYLDDFQVGLGTVGVEEEEAGMAHVAVMPNPFTSQLRIENLQPGKVEYQVHDITGRLLVSRATDNQDEVVTVDLAGVTVTGVYLLTLKQNSGSKTFRIVKQ